MTIVSRSLGWFLGATFSVLAGCSGRNAPPSSSVSGATSNPDPAARGIDVVDTRLPQDRTRHDRLVHASSYASPCDEGSSWWTSTVDRTTLAVCLPDDWNGDERDARLRLSTPFQSTRFGSGATANGMSSMGEAVGRVRGRVQAGRVATIEVTPTPLMLKTIGIGSATEATSALQPKSIAGEAALATR